MESVEELKEARKEAEENLKEFQNKPKIIIGMGTCGIAAGAKDIFKAVKDEVNNYDLDVVVSQTGCIGMCEKEPLVDVKLPGEDRITYGNVAVEDISDIISEHVVDGNIVEELAVARLEE